MHAVRVSIGDVRLFFDVEGIGLEAEEGPLRPKPTLLLLHGGPGANDHSHYKPIFRELADVAQVIYYDHRGNGRSERSTPEKWNLSQWADDVRAFCEALEIRDPIVLGTSFGGFVAQTYAIRHPGHAKKLILLSTASRLRFDRVADVMEKLGGARARDVAMRFWCGPDPTSVLDEYVAVCSPLYMRTLGPDSGAVEQIVERTVRHPDVVQHFSGPGGEVHRLNLLPELKKVRSPTLILAGEDDPITTMADAEDMYRALPEGLARLERFPRCGHPTYTDAPLRTIRLIREFLFA